MKKAAHAMGGPQRSAAKEARSVGAADADPVRATCRAKRTAAAQAVFADVATLGRRIQPHSTIKRIDDLVGHAVR